MARALAYSGFVTIAGGSGRLPGVEASTHNAALRLTRRTLAGQGYRVVRAESRVGHVVLQRPDGVRALVEVERVLPW